MAGGGAPNHETVTPWEPNAGITVLGVPINHPGSSVKAEIAWAEATTKIEAAAAQITQLADSQVAHHLLRACLDGCKVNHLLGASNSYLHSNPVGQCTETILSAFEDVVGCSLNAHQRIQVSLPLSNGGCGIKNPTFTQPAARIAALAAFHTGGAKRVGVPQYHTDTPPAGLQPVLGDLQSRLGANHDTTALLLRNSSALQTLAGEKTSQQWWSRELGKQAMTDLIDHVPPRDQARLLEQLTGIGNDWMSALPTAANHTIIPSEDYILGIKWWLGLQIVQDAQQKCPGCTAQVDPFGDHLMCCKRNNFALRHNSVQDALFTILSTTGQGVQKEVPLPNAADSHLRPADLLLSSWQDGKPTALDVTVCHGWQQGEQSSNRERWRTFLKRKEAAKHQKYDVPCSNSGWSFTTVALGTWGGLGPESAKLLSRIVKRASAWQEGELRTMKQSELYQSISLSLARQLWKLLQVKHLMNKTRNDNRQPPPRTRDPPATRDGTPHKKQGPRERGHPVCRLPQASPLQPTPGTPNPTA
jgi:hypothetical protein